MVKAIIFDFQGTLAENGVFPSPIRQVKNILRLDMPFTDFVVRFERVFMTQKHVSLTEAFTKVFHEFEIPPKDFLIEKLVGVWNKNKLLSQVYPETIETLKTLKGKYKLILVANIDCFSKDMLDKDNLRSYFDEVYMSCDTGIVKSEESFYETILSKINIDAKDVLMVGDSIESDIDTAKRAGINGVLVDRRNKRDFNPKILNLSELFTYLD